jgi:hypothetical protein
MDMAKLLQMMMAGGFGDSDSSGSDSPDSSEPAPNSADSGDSDFGSFFNNIDLDMVFKMGEIFSQMNKPDKNSELLCALKPHLRDENQHKIDTAMKLSRVITLLPFLKESGILNNLL